MEVADIGSLKTAPRCQKAFEGIRAEIGQQRSLDFYEQRVFVKKILAFLLFALGFAALSIAHAGADDCSKAISHVEQRSCLEAQFKEAEKRLTLTEQNTMAKIAAWDEDAGYRSASRKALSASNSAFRKYRANQCDYEWSLAAGGNGATDMRLSCAIKLTESRVKLLEVSGAGLQKR